MTIFLIVIISLFLIWIANAIISTPAGHVTVLAQFGNPVGTLQPGLRLNWRWPLVQVYDVVSTEVRTFDIPPFIINCRAEGEPESIDLNAVGTVPLRTREISAQYQIDLGPPGQYAKLRRYYELTPPQLYEKLKIEIQLIKDPFQESFRLALGKMNVLEALAGHIAVARRIQDEMQANFDRQNMPIKMLRVLVNSPPELADSRQNIAFLSKAAFQLERHAAEDERKVLTFRAETELGVAKINARARATSLNTICEELNLMRDLPPERRMEALLSFEALEAYKKMLTSPNRNIMVMGGIIQEIQAALSQFKGRN